MKLFSTIFVLVVLTLAQSVLAGTLGDVNHDGKVGLNEAIYSLRIVSGLANELPDATIVVVDSSNYEDVDTSAHGIVHVIENINISKNYYKLDKAGMSIYGGKFTGTVNSDGTNGGPGVKIRFGEQTVIIGTSFQNIDIRGSHIHFIGCEFSGNIEVLSLCTFTNCTFESVNLENSRLSKVINTDINNSTFFKIDYITNSELSNVTIIAYIDHIDNCYVTNSSIRVKLSTNCRYDESKITLKYKSVFQGNYCDYTTVSIPGSTIGLINISGNVFDDPHPDNDEMLYISVNSSAYRMYNITGNMFTGQSSIPRSILITSPTTGNYQLINVSGNSFQKGAKAIEYLGNVKTTVHNNSLRNTDLGVTNNSSYLFVQNNIDVD